MGFFENYAAICNKMGIDPCARKMADMIKVSRSTLSAWNSKGTYPKGDTVARIADALHVSADYLVGRTDDPTDYTDPAIRSMLSIDDDPDAKKADEVIVERPHILDIYDKLDHLDQVRVEAYIEGMLTGAKYQKRQAVI